MIVGIIYASIVFERKGEVYYLCIGGLLSSTCNSVFFTLGYKAASLLGMLFCELAYFILYLLYSKRIKSLGATVKYDSFIDYIPFIVVLAITPSMIIFVFYIFTDFGNFSADFTGSYSYLILASSFGFLIVFLVEVYMYFILYSKIQFMLDPRPHLQKILLIQSSLAFAAVMAGNFATLLAQILHYPITSVGIQYCTMSMSIVFFIDFYRWLIKDITTYDVQLEQLSLDAESRINY